ARQRDVLLQCRLLDGRTVQVQSANLRRWLLEDLIIGTSTRWVSKAGPEAESLGITEGCQILRIGDSFAGVTEYVDAPLPGGTLVQWITATEPKTLQSTRLTEEKNLRLSLMQECVIGRTLAGSPARNTGVRDGSTVVSINGVRIDEWSQITPAIQASEGPVTLALKAPGSSEAEELIVTPAPLMTSLGLQMAALQFREELPVGAAISAGMDQSWIWGGRIFLTLKALFSGDVHGKNLNGPVGIIDLGRKVSQVGFGNLLFLLALISINLGIFNLLPFPILDGGHILFLTIEGIRGKPVPDSIQNTIHLVAFMLLISMALFVTYNDLLRLW
ncbi:MAG: site-2 protease family protein, partial [Planctomycetota bacterium]